MRTSLTSSLLLPLFFIGCAAQQSPLETRFKAADANGDGSVTREEATNLMISEVFVLYDTNGDGFVDAEESAAGGGNKANFQELTKSTGGRMSLADAQANPKFIEAMAVPFDEADTDKNGAISFAEVEAYVSKVESVVR
ncbi:MAG: EF-hand domain-containing protein [Akkermansiaceae bacterium]